MSGIRTLLTAILVLLVSTAMGEIGLGTSVATTMTQVSPVFVKEAEVRKESRPTLTKQEHDPPAVIGPCAETFRSDKEVDDTGGTPKATYSGEHVIFDTSQAIAGQRGAPVATVVSAKVEIDRQPQVPAAVDVKKLSAHQSQEREYLPVQDAAHAKVTKGAVAGEQLKYEGMYA